MASILEHRKKVFDSVTEVRDYLAPLRSEGRALVTTNGCFDILHIGHIQYLSEAATLGDVLVVGINSDDMVRKLKGPHRPLQPERDRCRIVGALEMVDCSFVFREEDPQAFLGTLKPDIHVKGGDYSGDIIEKEVVERYGGTVKIVSFLSDYSTSSIIRRIHDAPV